MRYEAEERRIASRIERRHPRWHVEWGVGSHRFRAYPRFDVPHGTWAESASAKDLLNQMQYIEQQMPARPDTHYTGMLDKQRRENDA